MERKVSTIVSDDNDIILAMRFPILIQLPLITSSVHIADPYRSFHFNHPALPTTICTLVGQPILHVTCTKQL